MKCGDERNQNIFKGRAMKHRVTLLILLLALMGNIFLSLLPNIIYGFNILFGDDCFGYYGRINSICYRNTPIDESYVYNGVIETYPPGFHVLLAAIKFVTDFTSFQLELYFRIIYILVFVLFMFIIASQINKKYVIFALLATFIFHVSTVTQPYTKYVNMSVGHIISSTAALSNILTLLSIYSILCIFEKNEKKDFPNYIILFLAITIHGISHVGGFIPNLFLLLFISAFFLIYYFFGGGQQFLIKSINVISTISLSLAFQALFYWKHVIDYMIAQGILYKEVKFYFGTSIYMRIIENFWLLMLILFIISGIGLILSGILNKRILHSLPIFKFKSNFFKYFMYAAYVLIYIYSVYLLSQKGPEALMTKGAAWCFPFTLYFGQPYTPVTILTKLFGLFLYVLSFFGIVYFFRQYNIQAKLICWIYLIAYFMSFTFLTPFPFITHRMVHNTILIYPFVVAGGILYLYELFEKKNLCLYKYDIKKFYSILICVIITFSFVFVDTVTQINKEPSIIEHNAPENIPFKFGVTNPPLISNELIYFVNTQIEPNSHILATGATQRILASVTSIEPIFVGWERGVPFSYVRYDEIYNAMSLDDDYLSGCIEKYNVTYIIILPMDLHNTAIIRRVGLHGVELQKYFDSKLARIYTTSYGEVVYGIKADMHSMDV